MADREEALGLNDSKDMAGITGQKATPESVRQFWQMANPKGRMERFEANCRRMVLERRILARYDRCCHGGAVSYRLPLIYRVGCANGAFR